MTDNEKQKMTAKERQQARIDQLKAQLQREEAKLRSQARKDRNAQLVAFGIFLEMGLRETEQEEFDAALENMKEVLKGRTLEQALAGMDRLSRERTELARKKEISSEPPSQLPEAEATEKNQGSA